VIKQDWQNSVFHTGTTDFLSNAFPALGETIEVCIFIPSDAPVEKVVLRTCPNGEQQFTTMVRSKSKGQMISWHAPLKINERIVPYRFGIQTDESVWWVNAAGISMQEPFSLFDFKILADFSPIDWLQNAIFYQIFPDRFANGDKENDPIMENLGYRNIMRNTFPWGQKAPDEVKNLLAFYGGDLQGIDQNLDYLRMLGINAIYLNPVFTAFSNHRYDVIDYERVDPVLGGDQALLDLKRNMDAINIRLILDIVPNHCGYGHPWFQKALVDAYSEEAGFFYFDHHPDAYESWMGHAMLPKLNYSSTELRHRMYLDENSVMQRWLKPPFNADGWRVDVANMLGRRDADQKDHEVISEIRQSVKRAKSDAYLMGENFFEASSQLQGDGWDGVMNYTGFSNPLIFWLKGYYQDALGWNGELSSTKPWSTDTLVKSWQDHLAAIPWQIALQQFNLLGSHDTPRIRTLLAGNDVLHQLAAIVQFTFPGVPCLYYGDEIGLMDEPGFGSRNCMQWDQARWNTTMLTFYRQLIDFRKNSETLQIGAFQVLYAEEDFFIYQRFYNEDHILISANRSECHRPAETIKIPNLGLPNPKEFKSLFSDDTIKVNGSEIVTPEHPQGGAIWLKS